MQRYFFAKNQQKFFFFLSFLRCVPAEHLTTAHKTPTPRPRLEGDAHPAGHAAKERTTPACRGGLPCPIPAGLEVTHGQACRLGLPCPIPAGLEVTHGQACRLRLPCPIPFGWSPEWVLQNLASPSPSPSCLGCWNFCLFGCCDEKLIWVRVGYFWWEVIIKK